MNIKMMISDLDGTLTRSDHRLPPDVYSSFKELEDQGICRVIATGRNLFSARKVLANDFPLDYLVFSSGAGIYDWKKQQLLHSRHMDATTVGRVAEILQREQIDFFIQDTIPDNHFCSYIQYDMDNADFNHRLSIYADFVRPFQDKEVTEASQILAIPTHGKQHFDALRKLIDGVKIIRATSPLDHKSVWMEFFPPEVSKASGIKWLCDELAIDPSATLALGNDYNDIDMLEFCRYSYVVANAPQQLRERFTIVASNEDNGFSQLIDKITRG